MSKLFNLTDRLLQMCWFVELWIVVFEPVSSDYTHIVKMSWRSGRFDQGGEPTGERFGQ